MKQIIAILALVLFSILSVTAQDRQALRLCRRVQTAFSRGLGSLDRRHLLRGHLVMTIENSGADIVDPEYETRHFATFRAMEQWLKRRENKEGAPWRLSGEKPECSRGRCLMYMQGGTLHNHVYLEKMFYGYRRGRIYLKRLYVMYG